MSCFLCNKHRARSLLVARSFVGKVQFVCAPSCKELELEDARLSLDRVQVSWDRMVSWIDGVVGQQDFVGASSLHWGAVQEKDELHCIQKTGRAKYVVHKLTDLDAVPALNKDEQIGVQYHDGVGRVHTKQQSLAKSR